MARRTGNAQRKGNTALVIIGILMIVVCLVMVAQVNNSRFDQIGVLDWKIGALDEQGEFIADTGSIVTKDFHTSEDLVIEMEKDALVTYKVYWYNGDEEFISCDSAEQTGDYEGTAPEGAELFKVVITPTNDAEVSLLEVNEYAGKLVIEFKA